MSTRKVSKRRLKKYSIGDLRDRIKLHVRSIGTPAVDSASFSEEYDTGVDLWSSIVTLDLQGAGLSVFDGVNTNERPTHKFKIRYRAGVTKENVISWRGQYYKIMSIRNPEERNEYLELFSTLKGDSSLEANH